MPESFYKNALVFCKKKIKFGITLADVKKIDFLEEINVNFFKISSQYINNKILIKSVLKAKRLGFSVVHQKIVVREMFVGLVFKKLI